MMTLKQKVEENSLNIVKEALVKELLPNTMGLPLGGNPGLCILGKT